MSPFPVKLFCSSSSDKFFELLSRFITDFFAYIFSTNPQSWINLFITTSLVFCDLESRSIRFLRDSRISSKFGKNFLSNNFTICHPKSVLKGCEMSPIVSNEKATFSNSETILFVPNQSNSPPDWTDFVSSEKRFAKLEKLTPIFRES